MMDWQREVTNTLVEKKRQLSIKVKMFNSKVSFLEHEKEHSIVELEELKKKMSNERKRGKK